MRPDCPICGEALNVAGACLACNYRPKGAPNAKPALDPLRHCCQFEEEGQRCANLGAISPGLRGDGPWYCRQHYDVAVRGHRSKGSSVPPADWERFREIVSEAKRRMSEK